ncbi:MAG: lyase, partial [Paenibacillus sp.]|nr:lyase [Paenibacillus sp.]
PSVRAVNLARVEPLVRYHRDLPGGSYSSAGNRGGATIVLAFAAFAGDISVDERLLEQIRYTLTGGNDIAANGGYPAQHELLVTGMFTVAKQIPRVWNHLTLLERQRADAMMEASLVGSAFTTSDQNPFVLSGSREYTLDGDNNLGRDWNPNYREGMVGSVIVASAYFGISVAEEILRNYQHETFAQRLDDLGLTNSYKTFNWKVDHPDSPAPTGTQIEEAVQDWSLRGVTLNESMKLYTDLTSNTYGGRVACGLNGGLGIPVSNAPGGMAGVIDSGCEGIPNLGELGMLLEFESADGYGARSSAIYAYGGFKPNLITQGALIATGLWQAEPTVKEILNHMLIGIEDLWYKVEQGYRDYSNGKYHLILNNNTPGFSFHYLRSLWDDVIRPYHGFDKPEPEPEPDTPMNVALDAIVAVSSSAPYNGWSKTYLNDGKTDSTSAAWGWSSNNDPKNNHTEWIQLYLDDLYTINKVVLYPRNDNQNAGIAFPIDFIIEVSANGIDWTTVVMESGYPQPITGQPFTFEEIDASIVRVVGTKLRPAPGSGDYRMAFAEVEIYNRSIDEPIPITDILVSGADGALSVTVGESLQLLANVKPLDASDPNVTWSVMNETGSAEIDADSGLLRALGAGSVTVIATATDGSGITGSMVLDIEPAAPPVTTASLSPSEPNGRNGWYMDAVTLALEVEDTSGGVVSTEVRIGDEEGWQPYVQPLSFEDGEYIIQFRSRNDREGQEEAQELQFAVDTIAPVVTLAVYGSYASSDFVVPAAWIDMTDTMSGLDDSAMSVMMDGVVLQAEQTVPLYTLALGMHQLTVIGTDLAGNQAKAVAEFTVESSMAALQALVTEFQVQGWIDNDGIANSLQAKLNAGDLNSFVFELDAQAGKHITTEAASILIRNAQYLME